MPSSPSSHQDIFGRGRVGALMRATDWNASPLGPPRQWTPSLRALAALVFGAPTPMFVAWGAEHCLLYNDAYIEMAGAKHPHAFGRPLRESWPEIWPELAPLVGRALAGEAIHSVDVPFVIRRSGEDERAWFSFTYSPAWDDDGRIAGLVCHVTETTATVLADRSRVAETERLRRLFAQAPGMMAVLRGPEHVFELANDAFRRLVGRDLVGRRVRDVFPEPAFDAFGALLDGVYASGEAYIGKAVPAAFGDHAPTHYFDFVYQPIAEADGKVSGIFIEAIDITERMRVEARLRLLDSISMATRSAGDPRQIMAVTTRLLGESMDVTRCAYADVEPDNDRFTIRSDWTAAGAASTAGVYSLDLFGARAAADMRSGRTLVIRDVDRELADHDGGGMFNAIGIKAVICCPLVKEGRLRAMMAVHHRQPRDWREDDIALVEEVVERSWAHIERVRALEVLRESEVHLGALLEQSAAGVCETDMTGRIVLVNDRYCQILGYRREELLGRRMQEITHPEDLPRNLELFARMVEQGIPFEIEKRYLRPDGSVVWCRVAVSQIRHRSDPARNTALAVVLDMSERRRAEEQLREADRRKDEFLAMLAHELRNPLAPIKAAAELLDHVGHDEQRIRQTSRIILRQASHMASLVDDLLDVSRVTRGLVKLERQPLDAKRLLADAVEQARPLIEARGHRLTTHLPLASATVCGDQKRLVQIVVNLLNNAAKYTPPGGRIDLSMEAGEREVVIAVADNGIGMPPALLDRAFDLFVQAERTADRAQGGLGIGLALVKSLAELHDGRVAAHSDGPGRGSRFVVTLPRLPQAVPGGETGGASAVPARDGGLRLMIVDDNADAADMLALLAEAMGYAASVEHGSRKVLERARAERPDVFLIDIGLPDLDGYQLARLLRATPETADAVLIAVTGYGQEQDRRNARAAGFDHHFVKPIDAGSLARMLQDIGERRGVQRRARA